MRNSVLAVAPLLLAALQPAPGAAQNEPLSVIDWVQRAPDTPATLPSEAPDGEGRGQPPPVQVSPLDGGEDTLIGLVPSRVTGLSETLWTGSDPERLHDMLLALPTPRLPAAQSLLYALLLTEARGPGNDQREADLFSLARIRTLMRLGALEPAAALAEQAGVTRDAAHFAAYLDIALLTGEEDAACTTLEAAPHLAPDMAHRVFCAVRTGDWALAALLFDSGRAIGVFEPGMEAVLERFLDPELADELSPLPAPLPAEQSPLLFRLHEALGEPLPTQRLPRAYAVADLRDLAGWKAQLEAAERLAQAGALPANRLLGLYTQRRAAASGGIWDRVQAIQRLDTAIAAGSADAVEKTLPDAWDAMREAGLASPFATLFAESATALPLQGLAREIARDMRFITPETGAGLPVASGPLPVLRVKANHPLADAVARGFDGPVARPDLETLATRDRKGEALLRTLALLEAGAAGDPASLSAALSTLRVLGQERTARRAAAEVLVLGPFS